MLTTVPVRRASSAASLSSRDRGKELKTERFFGGLYDPPCFTVSHIHACGGLPQGVGYLNPFQQLGDTGAEALLVPVYPDNQSIMQLPFLLHDHTPKKQSATGHE